MKHTRGPWRVEEPLTGPLAGGRVSIRARGETVTFFNPLAKFTEQDRRNARLIAAAPELLVALEAFTTWHAENFEDFAPAVNAQLLCLANDASAAISKATGKNK